MASFIFNKKFLSQPDLTLSGALSYNSVAPQLEKT